MNPEQRKRGIGRKVLLAAGLVGVLICLVLSYYGYSIVYKPNVTVKPEKSTYLYIPTGSSYADVKNILYDGHYIKNKYSFEFLAARKKYPDNVRPGRYRITDGMSNNTLINMLRAGLQEPLNLTFNNIRTKQDLAGKIGGKIEADSVSILDLLEDEEYLESIGFNKDNVMALFIPNTYQVYWNTSAEEFMERMAKEYKNFWTDERKAKAKEAGLSQTEVSVLASIVQSETFIESEKPIIAGVYHNRLMRKMPLEADPTLIWAIGDFSIKRVLNKHKLMKSPYNTYMNTGLPPGPICLPSVSSIDAVLNYQKHNYLYFCAREDFSGYSNFAATYSQHLRNARKYQRELNRRRIMK